MASLVQDATTVELAGKEPWPENVRLFQPYEMGQILPSDYANCLAVKAFLKFCGLNFSVELRKNAEDISPSGKVPFLQINQVLVSEFDPIVAFVRAKGHHLSRFLNETEVAEMKAYSAMLENLIFNAELYLSWCDDAVAPVIKQRYGSPYTWPLNVILSWRRQRNVTHHLAAINWTNHSLQQVCQKVHTCCQALTQKLGDKPYFFGDKPTELDALVFGHLFTLITTDLPVMDLADVVETYPTLIKFCERLDKLHFQPKTPS